jgi:CheY-like chemotaxis protein
VQRILVVDDDVTIRDCIKLVLGGIGIEAVTAENGERALEAFDRAAFDGAIIDLMMPGMTGLETIRALRAKAPALPVIIVSGSLMHGFEAPQMLRAAIELEGVTSLSKPFGVHELLHRVRERFAGGPPEVATRRSA